MIAMSMKSGLELSFDWKYLGDLGLRTLTLVLASMNISTCLPYLWKSPMRIDGDSLLYG